MRITIGAQASGPSVLTLNYTIVLAGLPQDVVAVSGHPIYSYAPNNGVTPSSHSISDDFSLDALNAALTIGVGPPALSVTAQIAFEFPFWAPEPKTVTFVAVGIDIAYCPAAKI